MDRIMSCFRAIAEFKQIKDIEDVFLTETKSAYTTMLIAEDKTRKDKALEERNKSAIQADDVISIRQLVKKGTDKVINEVLLLEVIDNSPSWIYPRRLEMEKSRLIIYLPS
jgi:coatomer subunit beta